ncbi:MAG: AMP-binding protein, partial [Pseudomonadota bacterium]
MAHLLNPIAERKGNEAALIDEFGETSWADFNDRVNRLINALRGAGLKAGDTFAVLSGNRREYFEAMTALKENSDSSKEEEKHKDRSGYYQQTNR